MGKTITSICKKTFSWFLNNIVLVIFLSIGFFLNYQVLEYEPRVIVLGVGQGDSILLIDSSGKKILIDGGGGDYVVYSISDYFHPRDRVIDMVILTHPHEDHLSGLIDIFERYDVKEIFYYPACYNSSLYRYFLYLNENIVIIENDFFFEGDSFFLKLLFPLEEVEGDCVEFPNVNNASIVTKLVSESGSMLLMGDAEHEVEDWLMSNYSREELSVDVLKAGHHCSKTASSQKFLEYIQPSYAICSVGENNKFGHPHKEVIENFEKLNINYDLTYEEGNIVFEL
jgi:competence protein ComEC